LMGQEFGSAHEPTFTEWFAMSAPVAVLLILMTYVVVVLKWCHNMHLRVPVDVASQQLEALGSLGRDEKVVLFILAVQIALWFSRRESFPGSSGWSEEEQTPWRGESSTWGDGGVALMGAFVLFLIPSGDRPGEKVLTYRMTKHLPWDIIVLMGGGFAIAEAVTQSGTAEWLADHLGDLAKVRTGPAVVYNPHSFFMTHRTLTYPHVLRTFISFIFRAGDEHNSIPYVSLHMHYFHDRDLFKHCDRNYRPTRSYSCCGSCKYSSTSAPHAYGARVFDSLHASE
jgi:hypothetical protein